MNTILRATRGEKPRKNVLENFLLYLPSATNFRRLCFYTCLSVSGGGSASVHARIPPPGAGTHSSSHPPGRHPPSRHPLEQAPPRSRHPLEQAPPTDGCLCGRYASYWNAFLFQNECVLASISRRRGRRHRGPPGRPPWIQHCIVNKMDVQYSIYLCFMFTWHTCNKNHHGGCYRTQAIHRISESWELNRKNK